MSGALPALTATTSNSRRRREGNGQAETEGDWPSEASRQGVQRTYQRNCRAVTATLPGTTVPPKRAGADSSDRRSSHAHDGPAANCVWRYLRLCYWGGIMQSNASIDHVPCGLSRALRRQGFSALTPIQEAVVAEQVFR